MGFRVDEEHLLAPWQRDATGGRVECRKEEVIGVDLVRVGVGVGVRVGA